MRELADLDAYVAIPRLGGLALGPDGSLVAERHELDESRTGYRGSLWRIDPTGQAAPYRLTSPSWSAGGAAFTHRGDLLFGSARPQAGAAAGQSPVPQLWCLPRDGGEAYPVTGFRDGMGGLLAAAAAAPVAVVAASRRPANHAQRAERGVTALLHDRYPVRALHRDLDLTQTRLYAVPLPAQDGEPAGQPRDITPDFGRPATGFRGDGPSAILSADGTTLVTNWGMWQRVGFRNILVRIDVATGAASPLFSLDNVDLFPMEFSPDGRSVLCGGFDRGNHRKPAGVALWLVDIDGDAPPRSFLSDPDPSAWQARFTTDGERLVLLADHNGRTPVFLLDLATGKLTRLTDDDGSYQQVLVDPGGHWIYAVRSSVGEAPHPVRVGLTDGAVHRLLSPTPEIRGNGRLTEVTVPVTAGSQTFVQQGWLASPADASAQRPSPLLVFLHGGPGGAWGSWIWGWNPWPAVARGYSVLLANPSMSTGFGTDYAARGWSAWGEEPFTDLLALVDAVQSREDIDSDRSALLGCSYGGYLTNWAAGHTDRFDAVVSHAGMWDLSQFQRTTDIADHAERWMTASAAARYSPRTAVANIRTPMLIIHGNLDYRVPVTEALAQWYELLAAHADEEGNSPHRFLYFPDEHHVIVKPQNQRLWYETVLAFVDTHVRQQPWECPELLRSGPETARRNSETQ